MDFGGGQKPRLFKNVDENDPATSTMATTSKRQRSNDDFQDQLLQQQPPQTRRMIGMGLASLPAGSGGGGSAPKSPLFLSSRSDLAARSPEQGLVLGNSVSVSKGSGPTIPSALEADGAEIESESHEDDHDWEVKNSAGSFSGGPSPESKSSSSSSTTKISKNSTSKSPDEAAAVEEGSGGGVDIDEFELDHRLSYLQMRGYSQALLDVMDESILEESSEEYSSASELGHAEQVESPPPNQQQQQYYDEFAGVQISYDPLFDQPVMVTPERL